MLKSPTSVERCVYCSGEGWSSELPASLDSEQTLVAVFGHTNALEDESALADVRRAFPQSHLIGCSTAGEIDGSRLRDESVVVAAMRFEHTRLSSASAPVRDAGDSRRAGSLLGDQLLGADLRAVIVISDGLQVNGSELVRGLTSALPADVVITGGLAGDGASFKRTWVLRHGSPVGGFVTAVGLYGDRLEVGHGTEGGWDVFGHERVVTRSEGNVLYELDGQAALPLYKKYLGDRASELPSSALLFPLSIRCDKDDANPVIRTILSVDEDAQSMTFAGDIPSGYLAQLMRTNFDRIIDGAEASALRARGEMPNDRASLCIAVNCVGRRLVLGPRAEEELERMVERLPSSAVTVGYYSYGEIGRLTSGTCELHNQTMTITTFSES